MVVLCRRDHGILAVQYYPKTTSLFLHDSLARHDQVHIWLQSDPKSLTFFMILKNGYKIDFFTVLSLPPETFFSPTAMATVYTLYIMDLRLSSLCCGEHVMASVQLSQELSIYYIVTGLIVETLLMLFFIVV